MRLVARSLSSHTLYSQMLTVGRLGKVGEPLASVAELKNPVTNRHTCVKFSAPKRQTLMLVGLPVTPLV